MSPQFKGWKERPLHVMGRFYHPKSTAQNRPYHLAANLTIVHAVSLVVAKKLQCENSARPDWRVDVHEGGLEAHPSLDPA
ncbi:MULTISPECIES: hypothetical protein [unclassified Streptomyces]|uniref:hypothetical protein n=1 Tax=unclassified Streptomyces TaxID=2593676 RepID=UPI003668428C